MILMPSISLFIDSWNALEGDRFDCMAVLPASSGYLQAVSRQLRQCVDDRPSKPPTIPSSLPVPSDARAYDAHQSQQEIKPRHIDVGAAAMLEER